MEERLELQVVAVILVEDGGVVGRRSGDGCFELCVAVVVLIENYTGGIVNIDEVCKWNSLPLSLARTGHIAYSTSKHSRSFQPLQTK